MSGRLQQQIGRRGEMGFVGPFLARQGAREQAFADMRDLGVGREKSGSVIRSSIGSL